MEEVSAIKPDVFFVSGGTVPLESKSYVQRSADASLYEALSAGKFCYVLNSRQMGKSSLCVRTMARLNAAGARTAFVDLTKIGGRNVTPDQWYAGLVVETGRALGLRAEMLRSWQEQRELSPMQRFFSALRDVALEKIDTRIVIFVDEIDATRSLPFSANEFFAGIRECYNRRVHDAVYERLTFCLLGVAVPGDLVADPTTTPFNIGERILLTDFTESEAMPLASGLERGGTEVLRRILHWTLGHPFLTQSLAATAHTNGDVHTAADVDRLVADRLFQAKDRETNINLADVGNRILSGAPDPKQVARYRADILSLYQNVLKGREVFDDESNRLAAILKLSGIVRVEDRKLKVRNRIYERVFDAKWIRENMPGAELRRQRRAFYKGVLRAALVSAAVIAVVAGLAIKARYERDRANYEVYVANMNLMPTIWEQNNLERMHELLDSTRSNPARGWEWDYWYRMSHLETANFGRPLVTSNVVKFAPTGKIYLREAGRILEYSPDTEKTVDLMPMVGQTSGYVTSFRDGRRLLEFDGVATAHVIDVAGRKRLAKLEDFGMWSAEQVISPDGRWVIGGRLSEWSSGNNSSFRSVVIWDTESGKSTSVPTARSGWANIAPDGKMIAVAELDTSRGLTNFRAVVREFETWRILASFDTVGPTYALSFSPRSERLATSTVDGWIQIWDLKSKREVSRTQATDGLVNRMEFSSDGEWLAASAVDRIGRLYDVSRSRFQLLATFRDAASLAISPDKSRVLAQYFTLRIYDPKTYVETPVAAAGLKMTDGVSVLAGEIPALVRSGEKVFALDPLSGASRELGWLPGRPIVLPESGENWGLVERKDGALEIVDYKERRSAGTIPKKDATPTGLREFPDHRRAVILYSDKSLEIWDLQSARRLKRLAFPLSAWFCKVSPDGRLLAVAFAGGALSVFETETGTEKPLPRVGNYVWNLSFSADGTRLLAATANDTAELWDAGSGKLLGTLSGHSQTVEDASYSPDGRRIVTSSDDRTIRIWDAATLRQLTSLEGHKRFVMRARFTEDGNSIVSVDDRGTAMMWLTKRQAGAGK